MLFLLIESVIKIKISYGCTIYSVSDLLLKTLLRYV